MQSPRLQPNGRHELDIARIYPGFTRAYTTSPLCVPARSSLAAAREYKERSQQLNVVARNLERGSWMICASFPFSLGFGVGG